MKTRLTGELSATLWTAVYRFFHARGFRHEDSEDLSQDVMLRVWRRDLEFENAQHLRHYAFVVARHLAADVWRACAGRQFEELGEKLAAAAPDPGEALQHAELERGVRDRLGAIEPAVAAILDPRGERPSYAQAAVLAGIGEGALRTSVCRTRKKLRLELAELLAA